MPFPDSFEPCSCEWSPCPGLKPPSASRHVFDSILKARSELLLKCGRISKHWEERLSFTALFLESQDLSPPTCCPSSRVKALRILTFAWPHPVWARGLAGKLERMGKVRQLPRLERDRQKQSLGLCDEFQERS